MAINNLILRLNKDKINFFVSLIKEDLELEELKIRLVKNIYDTFDFKAKKIDDLMIRYECSINNFSAPKNIEKELEENLQEYFLVKHITTLAKSGYTPPY